MYEISKNRALRFKSLDSVFKKRREKILEMRKKLKLVLKFRWTLIRNKLNATNVVYPSLNHDSYVFYLICIFRNEVKPCR